MKSFVIILIFVIVHINLCLSASGKTCNMTVDEADKCAKKLMFMGDRDNILPADDQQMQTYCDYMKDGIRCIRHYARSCLPPFPQQVFGMFAYDAKNVLRSQCKQPKDRADFVKHVACFLPKPAMESLHLCSDRYIVRLDVIKEFDSDWRIPGICCGFHIFQDCMRNNLQSLCEPKTGGETVDYFMNHINSMTDDVMDFTCGQYDSLEKCEKHMKSDDWSKLKVELSDEQVVAERAKQKYFSPVPSLVSIIANYEM
ncbi:uncharacterized protein LOC128957335 [Oppia nitens]|uniref:uncharacterized protein LOC128957335 n=1 Tax=Oppia nitens TaxID=1686743 RepID=UPI0023D9D7B4|nr:uncharacterized protein LOC128957335 [Oppia nitens]